MSRRPRPRRNHIKLDTKGPAVVRVSLKDFVQTGRFGPVALGQSRAELRAHPGEPARPRRHQPGLGALSHSDQPEAVRIVINFLLPLNVVARICDATIS